MKTPVLKRALLGTVVCVGFAGSAISAECIAPANPGGGWDFTCRTIGKIMHDIAAVDKPIQVTNMAGGGGGLAFSHVVNERNDDADLMVAASSANATRLAQNAYGVMTADQVTRCGFLAPSAPTRVSSRLERILRTTRRMTCWTQLPPTRVRSRLPVVRQWADLTT